MLKFRPYQEIAYNDCLNYLNDKTNYKKSIVIAGTGWGKALLIGALAKAIESPVLVLQPSKELLEQNFSKLVGFGGEGTIFSAGLGIKEISKTTFATPKSIISHIDKFIELGVNTLLIDEAHLQCKPGSVIDNIIKKLGNKIKVIGFTATPIILVNNREGSQLKMLNKTKSSIFNNIIHVTQIQELIKNKYWSKLIYEQYKQDQSYLKLNSQGTEFTEYSINNFFSKNNIINQMKEANNKLVNERNSILIFVPSIADGESLKKLIDRKDCDLIHSYLDNKERELIINKFKLGVLKTLININIAGVGFDHPALDTIIHGAPTNSFARYSQHIGRGVRIHPNKKDCLILDFSSNYERFGKVENITYECIEHYGWGMFNGDQCLTSQPINYKPVTKDYLISYYGKLRKDNEKLTEKINEYTLKKKDIVFTFGKHKGETIKEIAQKNKGYLKWLLEQKDFKWENLRDGLTIKNEIIQNL